jgi:hypothetical protein
MHPTELLSPDVIWKDCCFKLLLKIELKTSNKSISLSCRKRKAMMQGQMAKQHERRARHEEHIIDLAINGANFTSSISHHQQLLIAGTTIQTHGMRKFTPQMIVGVTRGVSSKPDDATQCQCKM